MSASRATASPPSGRSPRGEPFTEGYVRSTVRRLSEAVLAISANAWLAAISAHAQVQRMVTQAGPVAVETVASGLVHPWGMAFLPDGRLLVTERPGRLRL